MEDNNMSQQEKRELRRKRRKRNQLAAYITVIVMILVLGVGVVLGVKTLREQSAEQQTKEEQLVASKEELTESSAQESEDSLEGATESTETSKESEPSLEQEASQEPSKEPEPVIELTPEQKLDQIIDATIEAMPLEDKVAGLFIVTPEGITGVDTAVKAGSGTQEALTKYAVGGIIYFSKNIRSKEQITEMIENSKLYARYPLFIAVDEEGGSVACVAESGIGNKVDAAKTIGESGDANNAYQAGVTIGGYLSELGFNLDFAPVADLANVENSVIGKRSYGADAATVAPFVSAMSKGLEENGVSACLKHFPGIGSSTQDTHDGLASTDRSAEEFRANEFTVFQAGMEAGADMVMVSHMAAPALAGDNTPSTLSNVVVTDILRNELGFRGVIITDALNMDAISEYYAADEAAILALRAGCDMLLMPEDFEKAYTGVMQAVQEGVISEERVNDSLRRIYRIKYADKLEELGGE